MKRRTRQIFTRASAALLIVALASQASAQRTAPVLERSAKLPLPEYYGSSGTFQFKPNGGDFGALPPASNGDQPCILLTGYWPPSNEGIRRFSTDPAQNPDGWVGDNWEGRGYDVHSFFPEFNPPDCNNCGRGSGDFEVDYQDTSADWWRIVDEIKPIAIITFSRGYMNDSWELEMNQYNRVSWHDDYDAPFQPTPSPPDDSVSDGYLRQSSLPVQAIVDAVNNADIGANAYICWSGDGGGFLSEFMAYHGVWSKAIHDSPADPEWIVCAGHVHVGGNLSWDTTYEAAQLTLREVIQYVDQEVNDVVCQADLGYGGPGTGLLQICGDDLSQGGTADLMLSGAPASTPAFLFAGASFNPTPFHGGHIVPMPYYLLWLLKTNAEGAVFLPGIPGGGGPLTVYTQFLYLDPAQSGGFGFSNAVQVEFLH